MTHSAFKLLLIGVALLLVGCGGTPSSPSNPSSSNPVDVAVVPRDFDTALLQILRCPENLTELRFATHKELDSLNERIRAGRMMYWGGKVISSPVDAVLIRADGKIGYRVDNCVPIMLIEEALVLDETIEKPNPDKYRK